LLLVPDLPLIAVVLVGIIIIFLSVIGMLGAQFG
jgi:hypothetical protein